MRRLGWLTASLLFPFVAIACAGSPPPPDHPNFLVVVTDDQRYDTVGEYMPETQERVFGEGVAYANAFVTTPLCCPSRASILTGQYAHEHGVHANADELTKPTFVEALRGANYYTGLVGKYLNSYDSHKPPRPEFDYWVATPGTGTSYYATGLNVNGQARTAGSYITDELRDYGIEFLEQAAQQDQPFLLLFAPNAPHEPAEPAKEDETLYRDLAPHRPSNYNEEDVSDKPIWVRGKSQLNADRQQLVDELRLNQLRSLRSLDRAIARLLDVLDDEGEMEDTVVLFVSDNGRFWGEHRLDGKSFVYDEATRVPFAIRYPHEFGKGDIEERLVANIDIAPTIYELAGLDVPGDVDGLSLLSLEEEHGGWREELLIEGWPDQDHYTAIRTERYIYIDNEGDLPELYDLAEDPAQMESQVDSPAYAGVLSDLRPRLDALRGYRAPSQQ